MYLNGCGYFVSLSMHQSIQQLYDIAKKPSRKVLGLMSGTSLDGLDIALCEFEGEGINTKFELLHFVSMPYSATFKESIQAVFAKEHIHFPSLSTRRSRLPSLRSGRSRLVAIFRWALT